MYSDIFSNCVEVRKIITTSILTTVELATEYDLILKFVCDINGFIRKLSKEISIYYLKDFFIILGRRTSAARWCGGKDNQIYDLVKD